MAPYGNRQTRMIGIARRVTDHPAAAVIHGVFGYKMRIEGTQEFYVDPVRNP